MALTASQRHVSLPRPWACSKRRAAAGATVGVAIRCFLCLAAVFVASPKVRSWTLAGCSSNRGVGGGHSSSSSSAGGRIRFLHRLRGENQEPQVQAPAEAKEPPGPWAIPFLGSAALLWGLLVGTPLQKMLAQFRREHGPVFMLKTGPARQVWVGDVKALHRIYERLECSGRPVSFKDPFGEFLFLTREPEVAAPIKDRQRQWLDKNLKPEVVQAAAEDALSSLWPVLDAAAAEGTGQQASLGTTWPEAEVRSALYAAVTRAFLGEDGLLSENELGEFMEATREYSEMRAKSKSGSKAGDDEQLPPGASRIRRVLEAALNRSGRGGEKEALPLIVAASIGGAEIFPTLLHWIVLAMAQDAALQERAARAAVTDDLQEVLRVIYSVLRRTAYSVALGPPRKILQDAVVDGLVLPEGALLFALHPAIVDEAVQRAPEDQEDADNFSEYAFGLGPRKCLGQPLAEALLPVVLASILRRYRIAGLGPGEVSGVLQGQLIRPDNPPDIRWVKRRS